MGGTWDATNVADARVAVVTPGGAGPRRVPRARRRHDRRREGRDHQGRLDRRARPPGAGRARRPGAPGRRGGGRRRPRGHRVRRARAAGRRRRAAGAPAGAGRRVRGDLPAAVRRPPGAERGRPRWPRSRRSSARARPPGRSSRRPCGPRSPRVRSPGPAGAGAHQSPTVLVDAAHNPAGMAATVDAIKESFDFTRLIGVVGCVAGKDVAGMLAALEDVCAELVVTQNSSPRAMPADELGALAVDVFGADRVSVSPRAGRGHRRRRSSWPRPVRTTPWAAPACWSPAA